MEEKRFYALLVSNPCNIRYLSGFSGVNAEEREAYLLLRNGVSHIIAPRLYEEEVRSLKSKSVKPVIALGRDKLSDIIARTAAELKIKRLGVESGDITLAEFETLKKIKGVRLVPADSFVEKMRLIKSAGEISKIKKAQSIGEEAFGKIIRTVKAGMTEAAIREKLERAMKELGAEGTSFDTIVAFGKNAALPHYKTPSTSSGQAGNAKIKKGGILLMDFGAKYKGYCGDMTRTVFIEKPPAKFLWAYSLVKEAQEKALNRCRAGVEFGELHSAAQEVFERENVYGNFTHSLGHGIGLQVHEAPYIRKDSKNKAEAGMVFSVEPGLYFPGWGGIRIEDLVAISGKRTEVLRKETPVLTIAKG